MALNPRKLEDMVTWCLHANELTRELEQAKRQFFADDDVRTVSYWPGAGDPTSRERRFLGYFLFQHELPDGQKPAEVAARAIFVGSEQVEARQSVQGARFVLAIVKSVIARSVYLELEDET